MNRFASLAVSGNLQIAFLYRCLFAIAIECLILLPVYASSRYKETLLPILDSFTPALLLPIYTPTRDTALTMLLLSGWLSYYVTSAFCTALDLFAPVQWKAQGGRSSFTLRQWLDAVCVSSLNMIVWGSLMMIALWHVQCQGWLRVVATPLATVDQPIVWWHALLATAVHVVIIDLWFYTTHWILHQKPLYTLIHKKHHRFTAPSAVSI